MKKGKVLHRILTFELDVQNMTPLRWPGKCARAVGDDFLGSPWGVILRVKRNESHCFVCLTSTPNQIKIV